MGSTESRGFLKTEEKTLGNEDNIGKGFLGRLNEMQDKDQQKFD